MSSVSASEQKPETASSKPRSVLNGTVVPDAVEVPLDAGFFAAIGIPPQNALNARAHATGPNLTNVFGTTSSSAAGAVAIRFRHIPGSGTLAPNGTGGQSTVSPIFSAGGLTDPRTVGLWYFGHDMSVANNPNFPGRYGWRFNNQTTIAGSETIAGNRFIVAPALDTNAQGIVEALMVLRRLANGSFEVLAIQPGGAVLPGQAFASDPAIFFGFSSSANPVILGGHTGTASVNLANWMSCGDLSDLIQLDGVSGTDAEWLRFANGEAPAAIWPSNVAAYYRLGGTSDLAVTLSNTPVVRTYRAFATATPGAGEPLHTSCAMRPTSGTTTPANCLYVKGSTWGYTHALPPSAFMENEAAQGGIAGLLAKTATVHLPVVVGGSATKLDVRVCREDDGLVIQDWTERTATAVSGAVEVVIPGVRPSAGLGHIYDVRRQDDPGCVFRYRGREDVGVVVGAGPSQSQVDRAMFSDTGSPLVPVTAAAKRQVTLTNSRNRGLSRIYLPSSTAFLGNNLLTTQGIHFAANWWAERFPNVRLNILGLSNPGTNTQQWLENRAFTGTVLPFGFWGNGIDKTTGLVTQAMLAVRNRVTTFMVSWFTSDRTAWAGNGARLNELFGNVEAAPGDAVIPPWNVTFAGRQNMIKQGLPWRPHVTMFPVGREAIGAIALSIQNSNTSFRSLQANWALGTGRAAGIDAFLANYQCDIEMPSASEAHHTNVSPRGNLNFCIKLFQGLARAAGLAPSWGRTLPAVSGATGAGTNTITVTFAMPSGWSLRTPDATEPGEWWVCEDWTSSQSWVKVTGALNYALVQVGNTINILKQSGSWAAPADLRIMYNRGMPVSTGDIATDNLQLGGQMYAAAPAGEALKPLPTGYPTGTGGLVDGLPIAADVEPRPVTSQGLTIAGAGAVHATSGGSIPLAWLGLLEPIAARHGSAATPGGLMWSGALQADPALHSHVGGSAALVTTGDLQPLSGLMTSFDGPRLLSMGGSGASLTAARIVAQAEPRTLRVDF